MAVTVQMIETKEFKVIQRGYDPEEVDLFLDEIVDEMERLQKEADRLREASRSQTRLSTPAAPSPNEETIRNMLINAQRICDDTVNDAKRRSEDIVKDARQEADSIVSGARAENERLTAELSGLRGAFDEYRARIRQLAEEQLRMVKD